MELSYINNPQSLFRKHHRLATLFANSERGKYFLSQKSFFKPENDIALFLPNGWHEKIGEDTYKATFTTRAVFSPLLYFSLLKIDLALDRWPLSLQDQLEMLNIDLGLKTFSFEYPQVHLATDTFNPDADPESTSCDGYVLRNNNTSYQTWADIRAGAGTSASSSGNEIYSGCEASNGSSNMWRQMLRGYMLFDSSSLPDDAILTAGSSSLTLTVSSNFTGALNHRIVSSSPASNTTLATGDFGSIGTTAFATDWDGSSGAQTLNTSGDAAISLSGISKFGVRCTNDADNSAPTWVNVQLYGKQYRTADMSTNIPILSVVYTLPGSGGNPMFFSSGSITVG